MSTYCKCKIRMDIIVMGRARATRACVSLTSLIRYTWSLWSSFRLYPCTSLSGRKNFVGLRKPWSSFPLSFSVPAKNYCTLDTSLLKSGLHVAGGFAAAAAALLYDLPCVVSSVDCGSASYSFRSYSDLSQARPRVANGWISFFLSIK
jgi:hypothetical protein